MDTEMLELAIEIEGLIRILKDGSPSAETLALLKKKTDALSVMVDDIAKRDASSNDMPSDDTLPHHEPEETPQNDLISDTADYPEIPESAIELEKESDLQMEAAEAEEDDILLTFDDEKEEKDVKEDVKEDLKEDVKEDEKADRRKGVVNLKSAFSLNDRFLYSRELFDGDMKMFDSTIKQLEGVDDFGVVEDYFYNELEWDRDNPTVQAFMERLQSKFK